MISIEHTPWPAELAQPTCHGGVRI